MEALPAKSVRYAHATHPRTRTANPGGVVNSGAYASAEEALDAALAAVETAAAPEFEGTREELEGLLMEGLASKELSEEEFWDSVDREASAMLAAHKPEPRA